MGAKRSDVITTTQTDGPEYPPLANAGMKRSGSSWLVWAFAALLALGSAPAVRAAAIDLCPGELQTSLLYKWPAQPVFEIPTRTGGSATETRVQAFLAGLRESGVVLDGTPNVSMNLVFSFPPTRRAQGGAEREGGVYNGLQWRRPDNALGDQLIDPTLPGTPLALTVTVRDLTLNHYVWIASLQCVVKSDNTEALARAAGQVIGSALTTSIRSGIPPR